MGYIKLHKNEVCKFARYSKGKLWGIILLILFVLGFGIWLYTSSDVKKDVDQEGIGVLDDMTIPAVD